MSPETIQNDLTGHASAAFLRYYQPDVKRALAATQKLIDMQKDKTDKVLIKNIIDNDGYNILKL